MHARLGRDRPSAARQQRPHPRARHLPCGVHGFGIGRADAEVVMKMRREHRTGDQRPKRVRQKKIGNSVQLIPRGQVAGDLHAQLAQILHRAPDLGARRAQLVGDARAADDDGSVVAQQPNDAAKPSVGRAFGLGVNASWRNARDRKIMRDWRLKVYWAVECAEQWSVLSSGWSTPSGVREYGLSSARFSA